MRYPHEDDADYPAVIQEIDRRIQSATRSVDGFNNPQFDTEFEGVQRTVPQLAADAAYEVLGKRMKLAGVRAFDLTALEREQAASVPKLREELDAMHRDRDAQCDAKMRCAKEAEEWKSRFDKLLDMALEKR